MKHLKRLILFVAAAIIVVLTTATIVESSKGTPFVREHIYSALWFVVLWAALAVAATVYIVLRRLYRKPLVFLVHIAFLVILLGAFVSWNLSESGSIHLRHGESTGVMKSAAGESMDLGFRVTLSDFSVVNYPGTDAPMDYITTLAADGQTIRVSMNHIGDYQGYRFMQSGYDSDMQGTTLAVYHDPIGIGITYTGYAMLLVALIAMMFSRHTRLRRLYHEALALPGTKALVALLLMTAPALATTAGAQERVKIDSHVADELGRVCVLYNSRITPINTVATDFVTKLCGKPSWDGLSATEVFAGWIFDVPYWETAKMIEIKDPKAQQLLGIEGRWASFADFWDTYNHYKLDAPLKTAYRNGDSKLQKQLRDADEKFNIVRMLYGGEMLKMFPYTDRKGSMEWFAPGEPLGNIALKGEELVFVRKSMDYLAESILTGDNARATEIVKKIYSYQHVRAKTVIPSCLRISMEIVYNRINALHFPVMLYLTLSLLLAIASTIRRWNQSSRLKVAGKVLTWVMLANATLLLALRWYVSGHLPMANGFETMQFMAWATLIVTIIMQKRFEPIRQLGPLLAAFALLVAMITDANPQITQLMPVLQSPLLSVHVMVIMFAYALFGLMALIAIEGITAHCQGDSRQTAQLAALSQLLLYPAVALIAIGIFIGAVWANVSWGRYWSWDAKETWALITMLIYSAPLHSDLKWIGKPLHLHIYMLLAFLSVLMTYFGVNYFLSGMHSYA